MTESEPTSFIVTGIIVIAVIVVAGIFFSGAYSKIFSFFKPDFNGLKESQKMTIMNNFDNFVNVAKECRQVDDTECICKNAFQSFPNTFPDEFAIEIKQNGNMMISPEYNNQGIESKNVSVANTKIYSVSKGSSAFPEEDDNERANEITLSFKVKPFFQVKKEYTYTGAIASADLYKGNFKTVLYITIGIGQEAFFSSFPKCMPNRKEAISKFDNFIAALATAGNFTAALPFEYKIFVYKDSAMLKYKNDSVKKYNAKEKKSEAVIYSKEIRCDVSKDMTILPYDKISVKKIGAGFCVEKAE